MRKGELSEVTALQGACPCPMRATTMAGSVPAMAATTMPLGAPARAPRPSTWRYRSTSF